ncbi:MurR/RpiR family transcriptional regulator [Neobacillus terrae]|uniref:MurR/RpiR family transcriptional regulator n=1 Tax=Neobacillus terrae TaxID=3034837 RepID=UPI00140A9A1C|nr:MurR/RpiR family transcriptional regulator [Neobacillus terrae]NHM31302.1 MurR/RpiR family transcriptional regulator [Neobacillus terrae]
MVDTLKKEVQEKYNDFSKGLKKVSKLFLTNHEEFALNSAEQVGSQIKVSETTVIRFCHALGYSGFSSLQKDVQDYLLNKHSSLFEYHSMKYEMDNDQDFFKKIMQKDAEVISKTAERLSQEDFEMAVNQLAIADRVLVSGVRSSHAMAHWFTFTLDLIRGNVRLFRPDIDDLILRIREMDKNCVFVAFSFHRYAVETINMAKEAKRLGAFVIGITDSEVAPIRDYADVLFTVQLPKKSTIDVAAAVFSLINALIAGVSVKNSEQFKQRMESYEQFHFNNFFVE